MRLEPPNLLIRWLTPWQYRYFLLFLRLAYELLVLLNRLKRERTTCFTDSTAAGRIL